MVDSEGESERLKAAIASLEAQHGALDDAILESAVAALRRQLAQLQAPQSAAADERKIVTVLFADISGFTALSEKLDPEEVRHLINGCFDQLVPLVRMYEGTVDKFIGDEIMALFGAPVAHEDDAERALRAALDMMEAIAQFNRDHGTELGMHIGVNTGRVVAGAVGAEGRRDYSVTGDAVNLAARLEDASRVGEIFVGPSTYRATATLFNFEALPPLTLKGKEAPVRVYRLINAKEQRIRVRGIEGIRAPLTGRDGELGRIRSVLADLATGRGCLMSIIGEAGLGKSRLIAEMRNLVPENAAWVEGRALSYTTGRNYWLGRELIRNSIGVGTDHSSAVVAEKLRSALGAVFGDKAIDFFPFLASLMELPLDTASEERIKFLPGEALQSRIAEAVAAYFRGRALQQPLVMVWEDLHWCDPSSLQLLEQIAPVVAGAPLLLVCAARSEETPAVKLLEKLQAQESEDSLRIELRPLEMGDSNALVRSLLKTDDLPPDLRDLIARRAEGNPFYIEELLRSLLERGAITVVGNGARLTPGIGVMDVPETLEEVLSARIDRLPPQDKATLQRAAVIGRIFDRAVLARLHSSEGNERDTLDEALGELQQRQFILAPAANGSETAGLQANELIFKHAITHEVAYGSLLLARRRQLHGAVACALEELFPDRIEDLAATLGYHYERAAAPERAAFHLTRAAERARATYANEEAIEFYRSAIRAIDRVLQENGTSSHRRTAAQLHESLGDLLTLTGKQDDARPTFTAALRSVSGSDGLTRGRLYRKIGFSHSLQRHYRATDEAYDQADRELDASAARGSAVWWQEKVQVQLERMHLLYWQGMVPEMRQIADRYRDAIEANGTSTQRSKFLKLLALSLLMGSRFRPSAECVELAERAAAASADVPNLSEACHVRFTLGLIQVWRGNFEEAVKHCTTALELAERVGDLVLQARCLTYLALGNRRRGDLAKARAFANQTLALASKLGMVEYIAMAKGNLAWVAWKEQRLDDTERLGREALDLWHGMEDPMSIDWVALWPLIATALARDESRRAVELAQGMFADSQHPMDDEVMSITREAIDVWRCRNEKEAESKLKTALRTAEQHHYM